jgi:NAD(P)-dependent dehydrogenase (short-subunit alcohol dehydrogenase family)
MKAGHYRNLFDLSGRVAVVSGGTGLLGRKFCAALADHGASVAVVDIDETKCAEFATELEQSFGRPSIGIGFNITDNRSVSAMADRVERELGSIAILHNSAQANRTDPSRYFEPAETFELSTWRDVMSVNLDGAFLISQEIGRRMASRGAGTIIQTASIYGVVGPDQRIYEGSEYLGHAINTPPIYSASKAGVIGLVRYFAAYWGQKGVRVNALTPGGVSSGQNETFDRKYSARVPMDRMAEADDIVGALIFLASDASSYVTGQNIIVDGGLSAW